MKYDGVVCWSFPTLCRIKLGFAGSGDSATGEALACHILEMRTETSDQGWRYKLQCPYICIISR